MSRWQDTLAAMPKITAAQAVAVKDIVDRHLADITSDFPRADEAVYMVQRDLDSITAKDAPDARDEEIAELKRKLGSLRRQINEMDNETGDEVDTAFMQTQRARAAQKKAEAERDAALKSNLNLQPLHEITDSMVEVACESLAAGNWRVYDLEEKEECRAEMRKALVAILKAVKP